MSCSVFVSLCKPGFTTLGLVLTHSLTGGVFFYKPLAPDALLAFESFGGADPILPALPDLELPHDPARRDGGSVSDDPRDHPMRRR